MSVELANSNVVVAARQFNPSVMSQLWLVDNQLLDRDDFREGCIFTDMVVNLRTREFALFLSPEQLQFVPAVPDGREQELVAAKVGAIVATLPHTPFVAVGINFAWKFRPEGTDPSTISRDLFFCGNRPLFQAFDTEDARFGGYLSKNFMGARLRLDIKPVIESGENGGECFQFAFNFNLDVFRLTDSVVAIQDMLTHWNEMKQECSRIMRLAERPIA